MKKFVLISIAAVGMIYAACSSGHHSSTLSRNPASVTGGTDTAMGGDAMKKAGVH